MEASALTACSGSSTSSDTVASGGPKRGGDLKGGAHRRCTHGHGRSAEGVTYLDSARLQSLYSPLVQLDANANLEYMLAESITPAGSNDFTEWAASVLTSGVSPGSPRRSDRPD
jgi:hypothetical protein